MKADQPILVVENDEVDVLTVQRAFKELQLKNPLVIAANGEEALKYLQNDSCTHPGLILLDLKMDRMDGHEFLKIIKNDSSLKYIPVVVLTSSDEAADIKIALHNGAAGYMLKKPEFDEMVRTFEVIFRYWFASQGVA